MNNKKLSLVLTVLVLVVVSVTAFAFVKGRRHQQIDSPESEVILKALSLQEGTLSLRELRLKDNQLLPVASEVLVSHVQSIVDTSEPLQKLLYVTSTENPELPGDLWLVDIDSGERKLIREKAWGGKLSPDGQNMIIWTDTQELIIADAQGKELEKIGKHGAAPIFSPDGQYIAYEKLADNSSDGDTQSLFEFAYGMAVYNIDTKSEQVVTDTEHGEDFGAVGFSADMKRLYFNSGRNGGQVALWSVNLDNEHLERVPVLKGTMEYVPLISQNALWSNDDSRIISSTDNEIILLTLDPESGSVKEMKSLGKGDQPQWFKKDESVLFFEKDINLWKIVSIR